MAKKKSDQDEKASEQQALEQRVDAIMNGKTPDAGNPSPETAPQLPAQLLKSIDNKTKTTQAKPPKPEPPSDVAVVISDEPAKDPEPVAESDPLEDNATDKAVDDIMANEADTQLAVDDAMARQQAAKAQGHRPGVFRSFITSPWTWLFILGIAGVAYAWYH